MPVARVKFTEVYPEQRERRFLVELNDLVVPPADDGNGGSDPTQPPSGGLPVATDYQEMIWFLS